jgi:hypothetical protein
MQQKMDVALRAALLTAPLRCGRPERRLPYSPANAYALRLWKNT